MRDRFKHNPALKAGVCLALAFVTLIPLHAFAQG